MADTKDIFNVLIIEDDLRVAQLISLYLKQDGHQTEIATTGRDGLEVFGDFEPSVIILDLMLPEMDGYEICRKIRKESSVPILMLTARISEDDKLRGLNLGADDYITKPFSPREVVARVYAVMRRYNASLEIDAEAANTATAGPLTVDFRRQDVKLNDAWVNLSGTEFSLFKVLFANVGQVQTRQHLRACLKQQEDKPEGNSLSVHISKIRAKLAGSGGENFIRSVYGEGYKLDYESRK